VRMAAEFADAPWCSARTPSAKLNEPPLSDSARPNTGDRDGRKADNEALAQALAAAAEVVRA